jgi:DNA excision repair protein ERCC-4
VQTVSDLRSFAKSTGKYPAKKGGPSSAQESKTYAPPSIQSKLVLLALTFPRVRIIWSSSPYATAEIFNDLKINNLEPDPAKAISIGAEEDPEAGAGVNSAAEELLRSLPGITTANMKKVMNAVNNMRQFTELPLEEVQKLLGKEPGKLCWEFMHKGDVKA